MMRADERAYRRRGRLWLLVVVVVAVLFWAVAPDIEHERITPVCEICGREATTALPDADGRFHAYCEEHAGESVRTLQREGELGVRLDTEGFPGLIYDTVHVRDDQAAPSFYMRGARAPTTRDWLWSHPLLVDGQWVDVPGFAPPRAPKPSQAPLEEESADTPAGHAGARYLDIESCRDLPIGDPVGRAFLAWSHWRQVVPIIEGQVLERVDGAVSVHFRLKNPTSQAVSFSYYEGQFVAGTYHLHPDGEYTVEGDDRRIDISFLPAEYGYLFPGEDEIGAGEERAFAVEVPVPADTPDPVKVSVGCAGWMEECSGVIGEPRKLRWVEAAAAGADDSLESETAGEPPASQPTSQPVSDEREHERSTEEVLRRSARAWHHWTKVVATIEDQVLVRTEGAVSIRFRLRNPGSEPVRFASCKGYFIAGTYYEHLTGDPYTYEGDNRYIAIWLWPAEYYDVPPSVHAIAAGGEESFVASASVPSDMPNPVTVAVWCHGPIVEFDVRIGQPRELRWVEGAIQDEVERSRDE